MLRISLASWIRERGVSTALIAKASSVAPTQYGKRGLHSSLTKPSLADERLTTYDRYDGNPRILITGMSSS